ncbi:MAG: hypothetical protein QW599_05410 [Nitrososphaerota archaeon]
MAETLEAGLVEQAGLVEVVLEVVAGSAGATEAVAVEVLLAGLAVVAELEVELEVAVEVRSRTGRSRIAPRI